MFDNRWKDLSMEYLVKRRDHLLQLNSVAIDATLRNVERIQKYQPYNFAAQYAGINYAIGLQFQREKIKLGFELIEDILED